MAILGLIRCHHCGEDFDPHTFAEHLRMIANTDVFQMPKRSTAGSSTDVDAVLNERGKKYGVFTKHAQVAQEIKQVLFQCAARESLAAYQVEALEMIAHKLARIVNGDPNYADSWVDIAGYAKLVSDNLQGVER